MKRFFTLFLAVLIMTSALFSSTAAAKERHPQPSLVALGDSITFGYGLTLGNEPSFFAFPNLMGLAANLKVTNLGKTNMKSDDLKKALYQEPTSFAFTSAQLDAVRAADYVTLEIGSNDFLKVLDTPSANVIGATLAQLVGNLYLSITKIQSMNQNARIVVYNIYNPLQETDPRYQLAQALLVIINNTIKSNVIDSHNLNVTVKPIVLADAFSAIGQYPRLYIRPDSHPTLLGQSVLAKIGLSALQLND